MIVYQATKREFNNDVKYNLIADKILERVKEENISGGSPSEFRSWQNSFNFVRNVIDDPEIEDDVKVAIEYKLPLFSKRIDFMIYGENEKGRDNVVIIELKQWDKAEKVDDTMLHSVRAYTGGATRVVNHPSYQASSYASILKNTNTAVEDNNINIVPCAYLHNYEPKYLKEIDDVIYSDWYNDAPFFIKNQSLELNKFIKKYVTKKSSTGDLLFIIENGTIKPSKSLQDSLVSLLQGNEEFILLDEQATAFDVCLKAMNDCLSDNKKRTIIIEGGPGTGKSVLAINLLVEFEGKMGLNSCYITKNSAPREAYLKLLSKKDVKKEKDIKALFRSPFGLSKLTRNFYDCAIIDESHRLVSKMYGDWGGVNQIAECINSSLLSIFLIDERQKITTKDIGSIKEIEHFAKYYDSKIIHDESTKLISQYRCNGSDEYINLIDSLLEDREINYDDFKDLNYDIKVFDNPNEFRDELRKLNEINNKTRMVAGYCYDWNVKNKRGDYDIYLKDDFKARWNLDGDKIWAINPKSFEEVGCIHTAQGLEFDYVGVIIGKDVRYDDVKKRIILDPTMISKDDKSSGIKSAERGVANQLITNTYKTLLTRGQKGCYIYCEDEKLSKHIKEILKEIN